MEWNTLRLAAVRGISGPADVNQPNQAGKTPNPDASRSFQEVLQRTIRRQQELQLSKHVQQRLQQRQLQLNANEWQKVHQAVRLAEEKGIRDSLVLTADKALIVNIPNRTVITAMERQGAQQRIFTNIDGAVIVE